MKHLIFTFEVDGVTWRELAEQETGSDEVRIFNEATEELEMVKLDELLALPSFREVAAA